MLSNSIKLYFRIFFVLSWLFITPHYYAFSKNTNNEKHRWKLEWQENFNKKSLDMSVWSFMERRNDDSRKYHSSNPACYGFMNGKLILRGIVNPDSKSDTAKYLTGAITTQNKRAFSDGKIEIRAKLNCARGAWPAFWMMPFKVINGWPADGELDIMEHLNYDDFVYQTLHTAYTKLNLKDSPQRTAKVNIDLNKYNTYGVEIGDDEIIYSINGIESLRYPRIASLEDEGQYPFNHEWYLMLCMQLGGSWVGKIDPSTLPVEIEIDWVKYYKKEL